MSVRWHTYPDEAAAATDAHSAAKATAAALAVAAGSIAVARRGGRSGAWVLGRGGECKREDDDGQGTGFQGVARSRR